MPGLPCLSILSFLLLFLVFSLFIPHLLSPKVITGLLVTSAYTVSTSLTLLVYTVSPPLFSVPPSAVLTPVSFHLYLLSFCLQFPFSEPAICRLTPSCPGVQQPNVQLHLPQWSLSRLQTLPLLSPLYLCYCLKLVGWEV